MEGRRERSRFNDGFLTACTTCSDPLCMQLKAISDNKISMSCLCKTNLEEGDKKGWEGMKVSGGRCCVQIDIDRLIELIDK